MNHVRRPPRRAAFAAAALGATLMAAPPADAAVSRNVTLLAHQDDYSATGLYSACWSYVHHDGREYAVIGHQLGTAIYNITDPASPYSVGYIAGANSIWREMKQYRDWIYVTTEGVSGLQVIRMTDPENPVLANTYNLTFNQAHTLTIDTTRALLFANGTRKDGTTPNDRGMRILSLASPEAPVEVGFYNPDPTNFVDAWYVHDSHIVGTRLYLSCIYGGFVRVLETADPANPIEIAAWTYPGAFTHNAWATTDEHFLFVTDEVKGQPLKVFDISTLAAPVQVGAVTSNPDAIVHNVHIAQDTAFCSNYSEGVRLLDITDPATPAEFGYYDTFPGQPGSVFDGCWDVTPPYPSGVFIASDRQSGLYVMRPVPLYGTLKLKVRDSATTDPVPGATARLLGAGDSLSTPAHGNVRFAPSVGPDVAEVRKFGYETATVLFNAQAGVPESVTVNFVKKPVSSLGGAITAVADGLPLEGAELALAYTPFETTTDPAGAYAFPEVPSGQHRLEILRAGFVPAERWLWLPGNSAETQSAALLKAAWYDSADANLGWTLSAPGDNATGGLWLRADPVGVAGTLAAACACCGAGCGCVPTDGSVLAGGLAGAAMSCSPVAAITGAACPAGGRPLAAGAGSAVAGGAGATAECGAPAAPMLGPAWKPRARAARAAGMMGGLVSGTTAHPEPGEGDVFVDPQPENDHTPGAGVMCFVTGNGPPGGTENQADVDNGKTTLTTPALDCSGMNEPTIGYWRWFHTNQGFPDHLVVDISNDGGASWANVESLTVSHPHWHAEEIRVGDHVTPTANVKLRFVAADLGGASVVEALVDDLAIYDAALLPVGVAPRPNSGALALSAPAPNPGRGVQRFSLALPRGGALEVSVVDVTGRTVRALRRGWAPAGTLALSWDGRDGDGRAVQAGLYWIRAHGDAGAASAKAVRVR
jgi:choice-of-anchor B domain-containing protein